MHTALSSNMTLLSLVDPSLGEVDEILNTTCLQRVCNESNRPEAKPREVYGLVPVDSI